MGEMAVAELLEGADGRERGRRPSRGGHAKRAGVPNNYYFLTLDNLNEQFSE